MPTILATKADDLATPINFFRKLDREVSFTLDPCASPENAKCARYYTMADNGLAQDWSREVVYVNPPVGNIAEWMRKAWESSLAGATVVCLVPARTKADWRRIYATKAAEIRFVRRRIKHVSARRRPSVSFASAVVIHRPGWKKHYAQMTSISLVPRDQLTTHFSRNLPLVSGSSWALPVLEPVSRAIFRRSARR